MRDRCECRRDLASYRAVQICQNYYCELLLRVVRQVRVEADIVSAMFHHQSAVDTIYMYPAGVIASEWCGHLVERSRRQQLAAEQPLFPAQQVSGRGIQRACRETG